MDDDNVVVEKRRSDLGPAVLSKPGEICIDSLHEAVVARRTGL